MYKIIVEELVIYTGIIQIKSLVMSFSFFLHNFVAMRVLFRSYLVLFQPLQGALEP